MNVEKLTYYYPSSDEDTAAQGLDPKMEGGTQGAGPYQGLDLRKHTLEAFQRGDSPFVAVAMKDVPYGTRFPLKLDSGKEVPAMVVDTGGGLKSGTQVDVATENPSLAKGGGSSRASLSPVMSSIEDSAFAANPIPTIPLDVPSSAGPIPDVGEQMRSAIQEYPAQASTDQPTDEAVQAATSDVTEPEAPAADQPPSDEEDVSVPTTAEEQQTQDGHVPPPVPNKLTPIDHVSKDGSMIYFKDASGTIYDKGKKVIYYNDPAGNMWAYGPAMDKPIKVKTAQKASDIPVPDLKPDASVEENVKQLTPSDQVKAKMFANYELPATSQYGRMNPDFSRLISYAKLINPDLDPSKYMVQRQAKMQYASQASNSPGAAISATNQAIKHLGTLNGFAKELGGSNYPTVQAVENFLHHQKGAPEVNNFRTMRSALATEIARALQGGVPTQMQIKEWSDFLDANLGDAQKRDVLLRVIPATLEGQLETRDAGWKKVMGKDMDLNNLIDEKSQATLRNMGITKFAGRELGAATGTEAQQQIPTIHSQAEYDALPPGKYIGADGKIRTKRQ